MSIAEQYRDSRVQGILLAAVDLASSGQSYQIIVRYVRTELKKLDAEIAASCQAFEIVQVAHREAVRGRTSFGDRAISGN